MPDAKIRKDIVKASPEELPDNKVRTNHSNMTKDKKYGK